MAAHDHVVHRFYLKNVAAFPKQYYKTFLGAIVGGNAPRFAALVSALKHAMGRKGGPSPPWSSASIVDWFVCIRLRAEWTARFTTYTMLCRTLIDTLPAPTTGSKREALTQRHQDFQAAVGWNPLIKDDLDAHRDRYCHLFVAALLEGPPQPEGQEGSGGHKRANVQGVHCQPPMWVRLVPPFPIAKERCGYWDQGCVVQRLCQHHLPEDSDGPQARLFY